MRMQPVSVSTNFCIGSSNVFDGGGSGGVILGLGGDAVLTFERSPRVSQHVPLV